MRIVTWNLNGSRAAWEYLRNALRPDLALLQEATPIDLESHENLVFAAGGRSRGSVVYSRGLPALVGKALKNAARAVAASLTLPSGRDVLVVSLHPDTKDSRLSSVAQILAVFDEIASWPNTTRILGGDLNTARNAHLYWPEPKWRHKQFWEGIDSGSYHMVDCFRKFHGEEVQTLFFRGKPATTGWRSRKFQLDHLFVSTNLSEAIASCEVVPKEQIGNLSDHLPLVAEVIL